MIENKQQRPILIASFSAASAPPPRVIHHSSLITHNRPTSFLFSTNKTNRIIVLIRAPMKTKEKQFPIPYKFAVGSTGHPACPERTRRACALQCRARSVFLVGRVFGGARRKSAKQKINGKPASDQNQPRPGSRSPIAQQDDKNYASPNNIKRRHHRITERFVGTFRRWPRASQTENPNNRQNVKNQHGGDDVVQQVAVKVAIFAAERIVSARQNQKRSPQALHQQSDPRHSSPIQNSSPLEEQPIARHGVISPRAGQQHPVDAAESGNHDGESHQRNAEPGKDGLQRGR